LVALFNRVDVADDLALIFFAFQLAAEEGEGNTYECGYNTDDG
jgi:hypothetical protein